MRVSVRRLVLTGLAVSTAAILTGCVHTTAGSAVAAGGGHRPAQLSVLARFLLDPGEVNTILGSRDVELVDSADEMSDHSSDISESRCLGALYNAEEAVYRGSGWTDVADQVLTEPQDNSDHWVEQTVVEFESRQRALDFFDTSVTAWTDCIGKDVTVDDGETRFHWRFEGIGISDYLMSQTARQADGSGWACQHALGVVRAYVVEVSACGNAPDGQAVLLASRIMANAK